MKIKRLFLLLTIPFIAYSCEKLEVPVPLQIINSDGSYNANYFQDKVGQKLSNRNFHIVSDPSPFKLLIEDFTLTSNSRTLTVDDDCDGGYQTYELDDEQLHGWVTLFDGNQILLKWEIKAANYEVLREGNPFLIQLLFPDNEDKNCTDYFVKSKCKMDNDLRACARQIAADAVKEINKFY